MAALNRTPLGLLRCLGSLRSSFVWLLLALLLTGAASYTHGSRYALVPGHGPVQTAGAQDREMAPPQAESAAGPAQAVPAAQAVRAAHQAGPSIEPEELEKDCCERRLAPRGEPVPVRTGVVNPPTVAHQQPGDGILWAALPSGPDVPALTVVQLSISRT